MQEIAGYKRVNIAVNRKTEIVTSEPLRFAYKVCLRVSYASQNLQLVCTGWSL